MNSDRFDDIEDDLEDDDGEDDDDEMGDLPEFRVDEVREVFETGPLPRIVEIRERTISNLAEVVSVANRYQLPIHLEECVVQGARIDHIDRDLLVDDCVFQTKVDLSGTTIAGKLNIYDSVFSKGVDCSGSTFRDEVVLDECAMMDDADFTGAVFEGRVAFVACEFSSDGLFDRVRFLAETSFAYSLFRKRASYKEARFERKVNLSRVTFRGNVEEAGSNLREMEGVARPIEGAQQVKPRPAPKAKKKEFNIWSEMDRASSKSMSRRQILTGLFRFLPKNDKNQ